MSVTVLHFVKPQHPISKPPPERFGTDLGSDDARLSVWICPRPAADLARGMLEMAGSGHYSPGAGGVCGGRPWEAASPNLFQNGRNRAESNLREVALPQSCRTHFPFNSD
jgi:hypothetical protein